MPIEVIAGPLAVETLKNNDFSSWPPRGLPGNRMEPLASPALRPGFQLELGEAIFTVGSCFARNIEIGLEARGFDIPTRSIFNADPEFKLLGRNVLNNYGTPSIFNEISWAIDPEDRFSEDDGFCELYPGKFVDLHLNHAIPPASLDIVRNRRAAIDAIYKEILRCRVVVLTLGLAEVWFDAKTGKYINTTPRRMMVRREPERFQLHVLDYAETSSFLARTFDLIAARCRKDVRVLLTVSPVPLASTHRDMDVLTANTYSKAVLRTACEEMASRFAFIDYYPSYESIVLSERDAAWLEDQVHPTPEAIELNCGRMIEAYTRDATSSLTADAMRERVKAAENPQIVFGLLDSRKDLVESHGDLALAYCEAAVRVRRFEDADAFLPHVGAAMPKPERDLLAARIAIEMGRADEVFDLLITPPANRVQQNHFYNTIMRANIAIGNLAAARASARTWVEKSPRTPEPYRMLGVGYSLAGDMRRADNYFRQALELADDQAIVLLDYVEHLDRFGRREEAEDFLAHIDPKNGSHELRLQRLRSDL